MPGLSCVVCRSYDLAKQVTQYACNECGSVFPIRGGVGIMFDAVRFSAGTRLEGADARQILEAFPLAADTLDVERVRQFFLQKASFGGDLIKVEAAQFLDRVRNTGHDLLSDIAPPESHAPQAGFVKPRWLLNYIPRLLPPGRELLGNVRFENTGTAAMRHAGAGRVQINARWTDSRGKRVDVPDMRTPLPLDIQPGQALTMPVRFHTPEAEGNFTLTFLLVEEGIRWIEDAVYHIQTKVRRGAASANPQGWIFHDEALDYDQDHRRGVQMLGDWLENHAPAYPTILEVGGNAKPMIEEMVGELHNVDVDLQGLQICALRQRRAGREMTVLCADAEDLPYQAAFFDAIVIFASLHHFPDPAKLLAGLSRRLQPGGFIAVLCEPVGHIWPGAVLPEFLAELQRGVNEQSFIPEEYVQIFRAAEMDVAEAVVDKNSLKARLTPKGAFR